MMSEKNYRPAGPSNALVRLAPSGPISPDDFNPPPQVSPMAKYAPEGQNLLKFQCLYTLLNPIVTYISNYLVTWTYKIYKNKRNQEEEIQKSSFASLKITVPYKYIMIW